MPSRAPVIPVDELVNLAALQLEQSIIAPSILNFGAKPYPEQDRFFASQADGRFISGGNRGGKTDAAVIDAIWTATNTHPHRPRPEKWGQGKVQLRFVTVDISKGIEQIMLPKFKRWLAPTMLKNESWDKSWDAKNLILTLANGSTIDFVTWGMDMSKLGGVPRHGIYFDEEPPQHIFNESMYRLLDYRGYFVIAATPTRGMGWTYDLIWEPAQDGGRLEGKVDTFTLSAEQNPYNQSTADDRDFYSLGMDDEERAIRERGEFVARSGLVFPSFNQFTDRYIVDPLIPPKNWTWYTSVDHGFNNPTAWLWHAVAPDSRAIITFAEHYAREMTVNEHAAQVHLRERGFARIPDIRTGDPAMKQRNGVTGTNIIQEYARASINIGVEGIPHDVMPGIEKMQQYLRLQSKTYWGENRPVWVISTNCINFIREMKKLRWKSYDSDQRNYDTNRQEEVHKKDDHAFDSARYFATMMPDLYIAPAEPEDTTPKTLDYAAMMSHLSENTDTVWQDTASTTTAWEREMYEAPSPYGDS